MLSDRDVDFHLSACRGRGKRTLVAKVESMAVQVWVRVFPGKPEDDPTRPLRFSEDPVELLADTLEGGLCGKREIEVF